jgi:V/A-type H+-transporting ATPase subunit E
MNGIDKLKDKILADARLKAKENIDMGIADAKTFMSNAKEESIKNAETIKEKAKIDAENKRQRILATQELERKKLLLKTKQDLVSDTFKKAIEKIKLKPIEEYREILIKMIVSSSDNEKAEVILSRNDKARLGKEFENQINMALKDAGKALIKILDQTVEISGGFILKKDDIEINNSFEAILNMKRDEISKGVVKILF